MHSSPLKWSGPGQGSVQCSRLDAGCLRGAVHLLQLVPRTTQISVAWTSMEGVWCSTVLRAHVFHALPCCCSLSAADTTRFGLRRQLLPTCSSGQSCCPSC